MSTTKNQLHFVMGKGGVGKTTYSLLLARYFAAQKENCIIVECNGASDISHHFQKTSQGYKIQSLSPYISTISITASEAIEDYLLQHLHFKKLFDIIFKNKLVEPLLNGAPGLHNAVHLGKIYDIAIQKKQDDTPLFDHIIVDCPATGHGLQLLTAAKTMMELAKIGPLYESNKIVHDVIVERADISLVSLAEELPAKETLYLWEHLEPLFQQKIRLLCINKLSSLDKRLQFSASDIETEFPWHAAQLQQWQENMASQQYWCDWYQQHLDKLSTVTLPMLSDNALQSSTLIFPSSFATKWKQYER